MANIQESEKDFSGKGSDPTQVTPDSPPPPSSEGSDLDDNYAVYKQHAGDAPADEVEAKSVLRKIDWRILPILWTLYLLQYLDKNGLNYASAWGLEDDLNMESGEFGWLATIFYFGYLLAQFPAGLLMQRLPVGKFLGCTAISWGVILMLTPACYNFAGIAANRFMLGLVEAAVNPGFVLVMSIWYTSQEQPLRLEIYYCTNGIATMFGGLIGYAVGHITTGLARWMYVFIIFGALSLTAGLVTLYLLPDLPTTAKFLSQREKAVAVERVAANRQGVKNHNFKTDQVWQTLADPKTWILFILSTSAQVPNAAITSFASKIIGNFGFDTLGTQYLQIPGGFVQFAALLGGGFICSKWPNLRCPTMIVANLICITGAAMLVALPDDNQWGRMVGLWLCYFQGLGFSMSLTMISSNISGFTKKQFTAAIMFTGYCVGNIIGPQTYKGTEGFHNAYIAMLVGYSIKTVSVIVLYVYMWSANKKRDRDAANSGESQEEIERAGIECGMQDMTELQNKAFRYVL